MAAIKVRNLWTAFITALVALLASLGLHGAATAAQQPAVRTPEQPNLPEQPVHEVLPDAERERPRSVRGVVPAQSARWSPWSPQARARSLPPTIKQRIGAEAHGSSPAVRKLPAFDAGNETAALSASGAASGTGAVSGRSAADSGSGSGSGFASGSGSGSAAGSGFASGSGSGSAAGSGSGSGSVSDSAAAPASAVAPASGSASGSAGSSDALTDRALAASGHERGTAIPAPDRTGRPGDGSGQLTGSGRTALPAVVGPRTARTAPLKASGTAADRVVAPRADRALTPA
ncbi:DUF6344 domain-containing protein [Streptomyces sp. NPDC055078]